MGNIALKTKEKKFTSLVLDPLDCYNELRGSFKKKYTEKFLRNTALKNFACEHILKRVLCN